MLSKEQWREQWLAAENQAAFLRAVKEDDASIVRWSVDCGDLILVPLANDANRYIGGLWWMLADWRQAAKDAYPSDPEQITQQSVCLWMNLYYAPEPRLLWLIYPKGDLSEPIGHLGFRLGREPLPGMEMDGVLSNPNKRGSGLMHKALLHIDDLIQPDYWVVYPKPDNQAAKDWYTRQGFVPDTEGENIYQGVCERWVRRRS